MRDWVDEEANRRGQGQKRPLTQCQHAAVNSRYPGCTLEYCFICESPTGRAGRGDDSIYADDDSGPYCPECWEEQPSRES